MLNKIYRLSSVQLNKQKEFKAKHIRIKYSENNLDYPRFGFVISKKIDQRAVVRNRLKRKLSISIEEIFDKISSGVDVVLIPSKKALDLSQQETNKEVRETLREKGMLND